MKLGDLFKPRWKSSDRNVRLKSLSKVKNQEILNKIAINDPDCKVRLEAAKKAGNQEALYKIAAHDTVYEGFGVEALKHIKDEGLMANLALKKPSYCAPGLSVKTEAMKMLRDPKLINEIIDKEIANLDYYIRYAHTHKEFYGNCLKYINILFSRIKDQNKLYDIIKNNTITAHGEAIGSCAVLAITDQEILSKIAIKYMNRDFSMEAFGKITDKSLRDKIVNKAIRIYRSNGQDPRRDHCDKFIEDKEMLVDMVLRSSSNNVRSRALQKMNDAEYVAFLAKSLPEHSPNFEETFRKLHSINIHRTSQVLNERVLAADKPDNLHRLAVLMKELNIKPGDTQKNRIVSALDGIIANTPEHRSYTPGDDDWVVRTVPNQEYIRLKELRKYFI